MKWSILMCVACLAAPAIAGPVFTGRTLTGRTEWSVFNSDDSSLDTGEGTNSSSHTSNSANGQTGGGVVVVTG